MSKESNVIKNIIIVMAFAIGMILLGLAYSKVNRIQKSESKKRNEELKSVVRKEFNDYGLMGDAVISNEVLYEFKDYVIYSDHIVRKMSFLEDGAQEALSRAQALSALFPGKPMVITPVPKRIMAEERDYGSLEAYDNYINQLRTLNENENIIIADSSRALINDTVFPFYRTKDGWTMNGSYYGYREVMRALGKEPLERDYFELLQNDDFTGPLISSCRNEKGITREMKEAVENIPKEPFVFRYSRNFKGYETIYDNKAEKMIKTPVISLLFQSIVGDGVDYAILEGNGSGVILVVGDREAKLMLPFFAEHFEKVVYIDITEYRAENFTSLIADLNADCIVYAQMADRLGQRSYSRALNGLIKTDGNSI